MPPHLMRAAMLRAPWRKRTLRIGGIGRVGLETNRHESACKEGYGAVIPLVFYVSDVITFKQINALEALWRTHMRVATDAFHRS